MNQLQLAFVIAKTQIGVAEVPGPTHNKTILDYHAATRLHATDDETPWCSAFVNWCYVMAGLIANPHTMGNILYTSGFSWSAIDQFNQDIPQILRSDPALAGVSCPVSAPTFSALARHWLNWGNSTQTPGRGDLAIYARSGSTISGHVGFYIEQSPPDLALPNGYVKTLGGNQSNQVCVQDYARARLLGFRTMTL